MDTIVFWPFVWILCACAAAAIARTKGRSAVGWFVCGLLFGVFALLIALLPSREAKDAAVARQLGTPFGTMRICPSCDEAIRMTAQRCRYCQSPVPPVALPLPAAMPWDGGSSLSRTRFSVAAVAFVMGGFLLVMAWLTH